MAGLRNPEQSIGPAEKLKFDVAFERFLAWTSTHVKPRTHQRYRVSTKRLIAHFGDVRIERMNTQLVEAFKTVRAGECSPAGVNRDLDCMRTFRNWCMRMNLQIAQFTVLILPDGQDNMRYESLCGY